MNGVFMQNWKVSSIPGGIQLSTRRIFDGNLMIEEIILEESPLRLAREEAGKVYPVMRRRK